jgi:hypothetical protein
MGPSALIPLAQLRCPMCPMSWTQVQAFILILYVSPLRDLLQAMARRDGRQARERDQSLSLSSDNEGNGGNNQLNQEIVVHNGVPLARWTEERVLILLETIESAPNRLYQEDPNWGRPVPHSRRGVPPPKNCLANIEYGDIGSVLTRARTDLNANPTYLALSYQVPISDAVLRDKYNQQLATARRLRAQAPDKTAFDQDESHSRVLKLANKISMQILSGEERRAGKICCVNL